MLAYVWRRTRDPETGAARCPLCMGKAWEAVPKRFRSGGVAMDVLVTKE
jgi:rubredoxin